MTDTIVSLCSGIGGLDKGLSDATGARVVLHVEADEACAALLQHRHPDVPVLDDVRDLDAALPFVGATWLTAGYPCQPFSDAGRRLGAADPRHLWPWVRDWIRVIEPRFVLLENVRGHVRRGLPEVLADLVALGYGGVWGIVSAADVGAPHLRKRVFVLAMRGAAHLGFEQVKHEMIMEPGLKFPTPEAKLASSGPDDARAGRESSGGADLTTTVLRMLPTPSAQNAAWSGPGYGPTLAEEVTGLRAASATAPTPRATDGTNGGPSQRGSSGDLMMPSAVHAQDWDKFAPVIERWEAVTGRRAPLPTETGSRGGRVLAVRFVEWMMGYADGWMTGAEGLHVHAEDVYHGIKKRHKSFGTVGGIVRNAVLRGLGNAVVPLQATYAVGVLFEALIERHRFHCGRTNAPAPDRADADELICT